MNLTRRIVLWLGRLVLVAAIAIFTRIGIGYLIDPVAAARVFHTSFGSPAGATSMRVGFGAFPLAFAMILAWCLLSSRRLLPGLTMVATVMALATVARLTGLAIDGPAPESTRLLAPELVMTAVSLFCAGFLWSTGRRSAASDSERAPARGDTVRYLRLRRRLGLGLLIGPTAILAVSALSKLAGVPAVVTHLEALGFTRMVPLLGVLELASAALLAFPLTRPFGLFMASAFLGGAIATHLQHGMSPLPPAVPLALLWTGSALRRWVAHDIRAGRSGASAQSRSEYAT